MDLPDDLILQRIEKQCAYYDKKSLEKTTGIIKSKYKLAGNTLSIIGIYPFFILTTKEYTCKGFLTLKIFIKDWEERNLRYLKADCCYVDITKVEPLSKEDILDKTKDKNNRFPRVARLCNNRFKELEKLRHNLHKSKSFISPKKKNLITEALEEDRTSDEILKKLDLV